MNYWLMKSEPTTFSIDDLKRAGSDHWDGVRNYQARNFMRDDMKKGDHVLFYHSNCAVPGIVGLAEVCQEAYPDHTAFDQESAYYDPQSKPENPRWFMVDVRFVKKFSQTISLHEMKKHKTLEHMKVLQRGNRLSITPVSQKEFEYINSLIE